MFCMNLCGMELTADFTAPALLALLSLRMTQREFLQMCAACLLHETAHLLTVLLLGQRPSQLRLSAAGMRLCLKHDALIPMPAMTAVLLSGIAANLIAAGCLSVRGDAAGAGVNLSLALFNLLPFRSTDGGTLLYAVLEQKFIEHAPAALRSCMRMLCTGTALVLAAAMLLLRCRNLSLWSMLLFVTAAEWLDLP